MEGPAGVGCCQGCSLVKPEEELVRCKACESVAYCGKVRFLSLRCGFKGVLIFVGLSDSGLEREGT